MSKKVKKKAALDNSLEEDYGPKTKRVKKNKKIIPMSHMNFKTLSSPLLPNFLQDFEQMNFTLVSNQFKFSNFQTKFPLETVNLSQI